jgi:hypothetical protein
MSKDSKKADVTGARCKSRLGGEMNLLTIHNYEVVVTIDSQKHHFYQKAYSL